MTNLKRICNEILANEKKYDDAFDRREYKLARALLVMEEAIRDTWPNLSEEESAPLLEALSEAEEILK